MVLGDAVSKLETFVSITWSVDPGSTRLGQMTSMTNVIFYLLLSVY